MSDNEIRVRFAPSPTGALHIGGARTAYFNWLYARQQKGKFILRIDDTDTARSSEESMRQILDSLRWLGLDWDEGPDIGGTHGPYRQSERHELYTAALHRLVEEGKAYPCFCTSDQLAQDRQAALNQGQAPRYSGRCRDLTHAEIAGHLAHGTRPVYRLRLSEARESVVISDEIHGEVTFSHTELDEFVIWKSDGTPTYHFASCFDDASMQITHIIRAEEHLSNTARHVLLLRALGQEPPQFVHVPMILAPDRSKLSKRHGATSVQEYRDNGFLPEAILNGVLLLGFAPGENLEIVSRDEAVRVFDLHRVSRHSAMYDNKKMEWLNAHYLRALPASDIACRLWPRMADLGWVHASAGREFAAWVTEITQAVRERTRNVNELVDAMSYYFQPISEYDPIGVKKHFKPDTADRLSAAATTLSEAEPFLAPRIESLYRRLIADWGIKSGDLIHPTRLAISGRTVGPGLFDIMQLLGRQECQRRMTDAADRLQLEHGKT